MDTQKITLVQDSFAKVEPIAGTAASLFYGKLFELDPSLQPLFKGDMDEQGKKLMTMIGVAVRSLTKLDELVPVVERLAVRHIDYGVEPPHFDTVGEALLDTLAKGLGEDFTADVEAAWVETYTLLASTMIAAMERQEAS